MYLPFLLLFCRISLQTETAIDFSNWLQALSSWNPQKQTGTSLHTTTTAGGVNTNHSSKKSTLPTTRKSAIPHPRYSGTHSSNRSFLTKKSSFGGGSGGGNGGGNTITVDHQHKKMMETSLNHINVPVS
ncbi:uncharacterized protein EV154DRAFT_94707 [Mucor mucedo]|uniref:uncharacterized protein n=1 Tax=Mucor mucedo TaxID=29922 RepID=UPI00222088E2|nr:uncharacterized protein EV154DRAFT_94707 [Mucor mucedo]KAI7873386.1 hypothetical protein EV154DRAFT_94707 [Mucor mucedo]